jgi:hypothetical protein
MFRTQPTNSVGIAKLRFAIGSVSRGLGWGVEMANFPVFAEDCVKPWSFLKTGN